MQAEFTQVAPDGGLASGKLFIKRPGKMRWEYDPPSPIQLISNGESLIYYDKEMDEVSYLSLDDSVARILTQETIDFEDDAFRVIQLREGAGSLRFTLLQTAQQDEGSLTMVFLSEPMRLKQLIATDSAGQITEITLKNIALGVPLAESLFELNRSFIDRQRGVER